MKCKNCNTTWDENKLPDVIERFESVHQAIHTLTQFLKDVGVPTDKHISNDNPLKVFDVISKCCNKPSILWT